MKYAVDRIEENIAVLENIDTKDKIEVSLEILPCNIKEGAIILFINNQYSYAMEEEKQRREDIKNKFNRLKK